MTGKPYLGHADYLEGPHDVLDRKLIDAAQGYDLTLITHKAISARPSPAPSVITGCRPSFRRTFWTSRRGCAAVGFANRRPGESGLALPIRGDLGFRPRTDKAMIGRVQVQEGIRPGVTAFSLGLGHWANGAADGHRWSDHSRRYSPGHRRPRQRRHAGGPGLAIPAWWT